MKKSSWLYAVAVAAAMATIMTACGSGRSSGSSDSSTPGTATETAASGSFGSLTDVCGPGDAKGATDQGVTDTGITIGYGDDAGFPQSPGLNHQMSDAMKAFISWCNDAGGINGRTIKGNYHDAKILDVNNAATEACATDFFLVGEGWSLDSSQEATRRGCGLPVGGRLRGEPGVQQRPHQVGAVPHPGRLHQHRARGAAQGAVPGQGRQDGQHVRQLRRHHRLQGQGRERLARHGLHVPRLRPGVQHPGRGRLEALRAEAEGLRGRDRLLRRQPVPELRERPHRRQPDRLQAHLVRRPELLRRLVQAVEHRRLRRQRLHA